MLQKILKAAGHLRKSKTSLLYAGGALFGVVSFSYGLFLIFTPITYDADDAKSNTAAIQGEVVESKDPPLPPRFIATHVPTPEPLKAIYMTSWVAGTSDWRASLVDFVEKTELNAIVIDIKDYSGHISFDVEDPLLEEVGAEEIRIPDIKDFIKLLHDEHIYVIGRITVFQDPYLTKVHPEWAIKKESDTTAVWKDYKGLSFIDPGAEDAWGYTVALAKESFEIGFDELNFDYIRFPSDGNMKDIYYPFSEEQATTDWRYGKAKILKDFFAYLYENLKNLSSEDGSNLKPVLSADLFGMVTTNTDDLNIGQVLEYALPYFDYISPMVYPSHYPKTFNGYANPNHYPYEVVQFSMASAVRRATATTTLIADLGDTPVASSSPQLYTKQAFNKLKLRPWLQDFDYGGTYDVKEVQAQIQGTYDAGLTSWMLWDPANRYTREALLPALDVAPARP